MKQQELATLTNEQLLLEAKKMKFTPIYDAVFIGFLIGIAVFSSVKNGFGLLSFLPVVYLPVAAKNRAKKKEIEKLLKERGLS